MRSAGHYAVRPAASAALESTLKLSAELSGYALAAVHVIGADQLHRVAEFRRVGATPLGVSGPGDELPCSTVLQNELALVVNDTVLDPHCHNLASVTAGPRLRSYIGVPLRGREGLTIGTLCVMDTDPHADADRHLPLLSELALVVEDQLELTRRRTEQAPHHTGASLREIRRALLAGSIRPYYQPLVDLRDDRVTGYEVLARWLQTDGSLARAQDFLPHATDSELIAEIDRAMLTHALDDFSRWDPGLSGTRLSVNASGPWARSAGFPDDVLDALRARHVAPQRMTIELTESVLLEREPHIIHNLAIVRAAGCRVALDDFGTGWASLEYLLRLPVDELKIDQAFTAALGTQLGDSLMRSTTGLASDLQLGCVVEGIENAGQLASAREFGASIGQGFYWSPALSSAQLQHQLTSGAVA
jgi:EAL domain-containing protein (putative c-di-GMP-specific phosphodiesterase class I)